MRSTWPTSDFPVNEYVERSNTGLTNTVAVDPDDAASEWSDGQAFSKTGGTTEVVIRTIRIALPTSVNVNNLNLTFLITPSGGSASSCGPTAGTKNSWDCQYNKTFNSAAIRISGFSKSNANNKICVPSSVTGGVTSDPALDGTANEYVNVSLNNLSAANWLMQIQLTGETGTCDNTLSYAQM